MPCVHPPRRLYAWVARDDTVGDVQIVACCDCGAIIGQHPLRRRAAKSRQTVKVQPCASI